MSYVFASDAARTGPAPRGLPRRAWRWGAVLAITAALHGAAAFWFARHGEAFAPEAVKPPVEVALLTPRPIARSLAPADTARRAPPARALPPRGEPQRQPPVLHALAPAATAPAQPGEADGASQTDASATKPGAAADAGASGAAPLAAQASQASAGVRFSVPPSGNLHYNTFYNGVENAPGTIHWASTADRYEMVVSVPLPFVGTFSYESDGRIDAYGLAPERYVEKRGRRAPDVTTFDRAAKRIGFTRTDVTQTLPDGAQDRFSMIMQLASLVRGDPDAYKSGVTRAFYVADDDSAEVWPIETIGDESVRTAEGFLAARHFMRLPRREGDRRRIDVWLAPSLGWLPARIVQTEPNGSQFELVWRGRLAPPGSENASPRARAQDDSSDAGTADTSPARMREQP
jgi:hypothetical protein